MQWSKFWWGDWARDPGLRRSSYAAKGLWMDMLCQMDASEETGFLLAGDRAATSAEIAKLVGGDRRTVERLIGELEANGVFSRDARGVIFCRRMVRDSGISAQSRVNGRKGGNPVLITSNALPAKRVKPEAEAEAEAEKDSKKDPVPNGTDAPSAASAVAIVDIRTELWREGIPILIALIGKSDGATRQFLGKCLKAVNDDCDRMLGILRQARDLRPADAASWIAAAVKSNNVVPIQSAAQARREQYGLPSFLHPDQTEGMKP